MLIQTKHIPRYFLIILLWEPHLIKKNKNKPEK